MKYLFFLFTICMILSCSKSEPKVEDNSKQVKVDMTFFTGTHNTMGGYRVDGKSMQSFSNIYQEHTIKKDLKVGDEITMFLERKSTGGTGKFGMLMMVNNRLVKSAESNTSLKLEVTYKITEEDTK